MRWLPILALLATSAGPSGGVLAAGPAPASSSAPAARAQSPAAAEPGAPPFVGPQPWVDYHEGRELAQHASESLASFFFWGAAALLVLAGGLFLLKLGYNLVIEPFRQQRAVERYFAARRSPLEEMAERAEALAAKEEHLAEAAELFERAGELDRAATCHERLGDAGRAARIWERAGRARRAAELYQRLGEPRKAAEALRLAGEHLAAVQYYEQAGDRELAATMHELAGQPEDAARIHEELGNLHRAARIYEEAGAVDRASEILARLADQGGAPSPADAEHLAALLEQAGRRDRAAEFHALAGDLVRAIELLVTTGNMDRAVELYSGCSENLAPEILSRLPYDTPEAPRFAQLFLKARDHAAAALAFENLGRYQEAAELYERCGDHYQAGEMRLVLGDRAAAAADFERAGDQRRAAELYELLGQPARAAENYEASGEHLRAGKLLLDLHEADRALVLLQRVDDSHAGFLEASTLVAELMLERGFHDGAASRLHTVTAGRSCTAETRSAFYTLGLAEIRRGRVPEAMAALSKVVDHDLQYRDAAQLLAALQAGGQQTAAALLPAEASEVTEPTQLLGVPAIALEDEAGSSTLVEIRAGVPILAELPLFRDFDLAELRQIWNILRPQRHDAGDPILAAADRGTSLYVVRSGEIALCEHGAGGARTERILGPGDHFGELALIAGQALAAELIARTEVELLVLPRAPLRELMDRHDGIALKLYRVFTQQLAAQLTGAHGGPPTDPPDEGS